MQNQSKVNGQQNNSLQKSQEIDKKKRTILATDLEMKFKIVLVGDSNVGKTSIFWRYIEDFFDESSQQESTVTMVDFRMKNQIIDSDLVKLYIWDTAGQERYRSVISTYFKGAHAVVGVFDLTDPSSFTSLNTHWIKQCREKSNNALFILVGNKKDLCEQQRQSINSSATQKVKMVDQEMINEFCKENDIEYFEVSAKTGSNIEEMFIHMAMIIRDKHFGQKTPDNGVNKDNFAPSQNNSDNNQNSINNRTSFTLNSGKKDLKKKTGEKKNKGCC